MYNKVVVPLDGSNLAELALPHLEEIATGCHIPDILLVSVTEEIKGQVGQSQVHQPFVPEKPVAVPLPAAAAAQFAVIFDSHTYGVQDVAMTLGKMAKTATDYLCRVAEDLEKKGFDVTATILLGKPAEQIARYANEQGADLIIMASTGKSKISRWDMSTIAARVIKDTCIPVLLVKPDADFKETKPKRKGVAL
jgi:nucleotide-binding universal stress UspA family protein